MAPRGMLKTLGGLDEESVAGRMAKRVVDDFELVEVETVQRKKATVATADAKRMVELLRADVFFF